MDGIKRSAMDSLLFQSPDRGVSVLERESVLDIFWHVLKRNCFGEMTIPTFKFFSIKLASLPGWKSAHTALAVKACLLGGNSNTKCSMTFVNIAVAISALAGGGAQKRFRTETRIRWCFRHFSRIFGCLRARGYWNGILGHFGSFPAVEKRPQMKKNIVHSKILQGFWMPEHWKHCKNKCFGLTL